MVTVTIRYHILDNYSKSTCAVQGCGACDVSLACAACGHVDSVEGWTLEIWNILCQQPLHHSALKSSLKTAKRLQLDGTKTAMDWTCSLGLSVLRLEDRKKTGCGGPVLSVETNLLYPYNYPSKRI